MRILSGRAGFIGLTLVALLVILLATVSIGMAQDVTYGGEMTLSWNIDVFSCPTGIFCPGQELIETTASGSEIIPLSANYSSCSVNPVGSGPVIAPLGFGAPDIVLVVPSGTDTCPFLFYPGPGGFWYDGDITTPDGSFSVLPPTEGEFLPPSGQLDILSRDATNTYPTSLTFNAAGSDVLCDSPASPDCFGFGYSENSWSFNGELTACTATYDGTLNSNMTISSGLTCIVGGTVTGKVTQNGGGLFADNATIEGGLQITGASTFSIEDTVINGNVQINNISAGPAQNQICGTDIKGRVQLNNNGAAVAIGTTSASCPGNKIGGRMQFNHNRAALQVSDDTAGGDLQCHSNSSITGSGDTADSLQGQCAAFQ
jgi:hypothetical protein